MSSNTATMQDMAPAVAEEPITDVELLSPRWPAVVSILAVALLNMALPASLQFGPRWLLLVAVIAFMVPVYITHRTGEHAVNHVLGQIVSGIVTTSLIISLSLLVQGLIAHKETPLEMLRAAAILWITNVIVFASWYWRLDAGGPHIRDKREAHSSGAFLFPQMTIKPEYAEEGAGEDWMPQFVDYLFLAFNTSTAFSPSDTPVLSRWAKAFCMAQSGISLTIIVILAARVVNIL